MHVVPYVSTTYAKRLVQLPKRTMYNALGCTCIKNFKPEIGGEYAGRDGGGNIEYRITKFNWAQEVVEHKEKLQAENLWPEKEGDDLEKELLSAKYCKKFKRCACEVKSKSSRAIISGAVSTGVALTGPVFLATFPGLALIYFSILGYSGYSLYRAAEYKKILSTIAYHDMRRNFSSVCYYFDKKQLALRDKNEEQEKKHKLEDQNNKE